jgi:hypothetical protein
MDGMDYSLFDDEMWQKIDNNMGHMSERREILDLKNHNRKISVLDQLRLDMTRYLHTKLAKKLNAPNITIPWSKMKAQDIINWPPDVEFLSVYHLKINELKKLHELAKKDLLDFAPEFLGRVNKRTSYNYKLRSDITKYLADKLPKKFNWSSNIVPWSRMNVKDMINWPPDVEFIPISKMNTKDIKRLHKLTKDGLLDFSPEFLGRFKKRRISKWLLLKNQLKSDVTNSR